MTGSLPNMTNLHIVGFSDRHSDFDKCPNVKILKIDQGSLRESRPFRLLSHLSKLILYFVRIDEVALTAFRDLSVLRTLELGNCRVLCDWGVFGVALAQTPVKSITFRHIYCHAPDIESLLNSVELDYLFLSNFASNFASNTERGDFPYDLYRSFEQAFSCKRENPRKSFLIEQDRFGRTHNGTILT